MKTFSLSNNDLIVKYFVDVILGYKIMMHYRLKNVSDINQYVCMIRNLSTLNVRNNTSKRCLSSGSNDTKSFSEIPGPKGLPYLGTYLDYKTGKFAIDYW